MDGDGSTTPASDANPNPEGTPGGGGAGDGAGAVTPTADAFADERNKLNAQIRDFQSQKDRLAKEVADLKAASGGSAPAPGSTTQPEPLSAEGVMALLKRDRELTSAVSQFKSDFPLADPAIFAGYDGYDSVEAFRAAAESSHGAVKSLVDQAVGPQLTAAVEAALKPYVEKYGRLAAPPAPAGEGTPTGMPSREEVRQFSADQLAVFVEKHGEAALNSLIYG